MSWYDWTVSCCHLLSPFHWMVLANFNVKPLGSLLQPGLRNLHIRLLVTNGFPKQLYIPVHVHYLLHYLQMERIDCHEYAWFQLSTSKGLGLRVVVSWIELYRPAAGGLGVCLGHQSSLWPWCWRRCLQRWTDSTWHWRMPWDRRRSLHAASRSPPSRAATLLCCFVWTWSMNMECSGFKCNDVKA